MSCEPLECYFVIESNIHTKAIPFFIFFFLQIYKSVVYNLLFTISYLYFFAINFPSWKSEFEKQQCIPK